MTHQPYLTIVNHYVECLRSHGTGPHAVDWKSLEDAALRYDVMLGLMSERSVGATLLDFGCGLAALKAHMQWGGYREIEYTGLEISDEFASAARAQHPGTAILCMDVLADGVSLPEFDYIVMNGVFTRRQDLSFQEMNRYMRQLLLVVYRSCRIGLAFNVMSKAVDWESDQLFHPDPGDLLSFVGEHLTRHFVFRNDYGLHELTCYLYRKPIGHHANQGGQ